MRLFFGSPASAPARLTGSSGKMGFGCLVLFSAPFCVAGVAIAFAAARKAFLPSPEWRDVALLGIAGLAFAVAGFGLLTAAVVGRKKLQQQEALRRLHPDAPWMWRQDWAQGRVASATESNMVIAWIFAALWNLVSAPILLLGILDKVKEDPKVAIALLFPAVGIGLLVWAVRETLRFREFGATAFEMSSVPGVIGGELRGAIQARFDARPAQGVLVKLSCVNRTVTGSGRDRSVWEKILWHEERRVAPGELGVGPTGTSIPVSFQVPLDAAGTNSENPDDSILWILEADADVPGVNYRDRFEVPVFKTRETPAAARPSAGEASSEPFAQEAFGPTGPAKLAEEPLRRPEHSRIVVKPSASGGTEFDFSAARNPGAALGLTAFLLLWSGSIWLMLSLKAPIFFPIVFGLFDVLIFFLVLQLWFGASRVGIGPGLLIARRSLLGLGSSRQIQCSEIAAIKMPIGMQSGGASGTPFYDIRLVLKNGKEMTIGRQVRDKREAEWLVAEMRKAIGL